MSSIIVRTKWGWMEVPRDDTFVGGSLQLLGEYSPVESRFLQLLLGEDDVAVDVGANVGALTIPMAHVAKKVYAFEPQSEIFKMLEKNVQSNGLGEKVVLVQAACGEKEGKASMALRQEGNWGSATVVEGDEVDVVRLDSAIDEKVDLLKIDVEGFEVEVLRGAVGLLHDDIVVIAEADQPGPGKRLLEWLKEHEFEVRWFITPLYHPDNHNKCKDNPFGLTCSFNVIAWYKRGKWGDAFEGLTPVDAIKEIGTAPLSAIVGEVYKSAR